MNLLTDPRAHQAARRATTAMSILDVGAWIGLFAGMLFWSNFFWLMLAPASPPELALMLAMAAGYSVVLPMLLSTLVPSTPAGMLLQQTRWRTIGFAATVGVTGFLGYHALMILWGFWASKPNVLASGQDLPMAIGSLIIFVFVPALAWVQAVPDRWVAEVQAAMAVRKLTLAHEANIMAAKTEYLRTISLLRRGVANLSAAEHRELAGGLVMFQRAENEALGTIVDTLEAITGVSTGVRLVEDAALEQSYTDITTQLGRLIAAPNEADYVEPAPASAPALPSVRARAPAEPWDGAELPPPAPTRPDALEPVSVRPTLHATVAQGGAGCATVAQGGADGDPFAEFLATAQAKLAPTWTVKQLAEALGVSESQARSLANGWVDLEWVDRTKLRGFYSFREG
jgi:hypothetical protein